MSERAQVMDNIVGQFARIFDCGVGCHRRPLSQAYSLLACAGASYSLHAGSGHAATAEKNLPQSSRPRVPGLTASNALVEYYVWFFPGGRPRTAAAQHFCHRGGIGRRAWFRSMYPQGCGGSSPFDGTITLKAPFEASVAAHEVLRYAQDFACGLPLRSRPHTGSSSSPFFGTKFIDSSRHRIIGSLSSWLRSLKPAANTSMIR